MFVSEKALGMVYVVLGGVYMAHEGMMHVVHEVAYVVLEIEMHADHGVI